MPTDLQTQLRELVEAASPVAPNEAIDRSEASPIGEISLERERRHAVRPWLVAASATALVGAGIGWVASSGSSNPSRYIKATPSTGRPPKVILTAAEIHRITTRSIAASASSGTAEVVQTSTDNGVTQTGYDTAVTFSGSDIDEKITTHPEPAGSSPSTTTDDRLVGGEFYIYTPGPNDVPEWLHDTNSGNNASMEFPDPRTLYGAINPDAQFTSAGTSQLNGLTVIHLVAGDPKAIATAPLGNLVGDATPTSFEVWVDGNDVVEKMALSTSFSTYECGRSTPLSEQPLTQPMMKELAPYERMRDGKKLIVAGLVPASIMKTIPGEHCSTIKSAGSVTITYGDLGTPQTITAPSGAVDFSGKG